MQELDIYIDGASKGNPGPSGIGVIICRSGEVIRNLSVFIGDTTNNVAEYTALIYALQEALLLRADILKIKTDSQLLARQLKKDYKVKSLKLLSLYSQAEHLLKGFKRVFIENIPREMNKGADRLATEAIRKRLKGQVGCGCS
ncbi:MAG: ribonuclease HI family protein [Candidatus Omnitrophota bacterium]